MSRSMPERSEEHTSELQSPYDLVCRLLLEKKKKQQTNDTLSKKKNKKQKKKPKTELDHFLNLVFFFNDTSTTVIDSLSLHDAFFSNVPAAARIYTLPLHDALPI